MKFKLILASTSPRRSELLEKAGFKFLVDSVKVSEIIDENLNPRDAVMQLARLKALTLVEERKLMKSKGKLVLGADTMVLVDDQLLGKPEDEAQARQFLDQMSGRSHSVVTGFCLVVTETGEAVCAYDETKVWFKQLSLKNIEDYIKSGEPLGKAGAYAIQGEGGKLVDHIEGSLSNVIGLPMEKLESVLRQKRWELT
ncbi:MAG: septum formation protein Maf [Bdellovibrionales bacterium]|nr:septum formation protein Maf [Bdellovibrionales bacterium]